MGKGYYIVGAVLFGVGAFLLYTKIKNGNVNFNIRNEEIAQVEEGSHLNPPMETPITVPPLATTPII
jgi:hypothetical protein